MRYGDRIAVVGHSVRVSLPSKRWSARRHVAVPGLAGDRPIMVQSIREIHHGTFNSLWLLACRFHHHPDRPVVAVGSSRPGWRYLTMRQLHCRRLRLRTGAAGATDRAMILPSSMMNAAAEATMSSSVIMYSYRIPESPSIILVGLRNLAAVRALCSEIAIERAARHPCAGRHEVGSRIDDCDVHGQPLRVASAAAAWIRDCARCALMGAPYGSLNGILSGMASSAMAAPDRPPLAPASNAVPRTNTA